MTANTEARDLDAIVAKVQALLNNKGRTPEEAAAYVAKAHELLAKYELSMDDIGALKADPRTAVSRGAEVARTVKGKPDGWKADVLRQVARTFGTRVVTSWDSERTKSGKYRTVYSYSLVGFKHDIDAARFAFDYLVAEITRLSKEYSRPMWDSIKADAKRWNVSVHEAESDFALREGTHPLKAEVYFVKGAAQTIGEALAQSSARERSEAVAHNPNAIVVQKEAEIEEFLGRETHGDRWEQIKADRIARTDRWEQERLDRIAREAEERAKETPAQRRRREAREQRESEKEARRADRESQAYWNRYYREQAKIDMDALVAGQRAGKSLRVNRTGLEG
jgi:hypothetical protein